MERRLVACRHADISGYSRLISDDVEKTVRMLTTYHAVIGGIVGSHSGLWFHGGACDPRGHRAGRREPGSPAGARV